MLSTRRYAAFLAVGATFAVPIAGCGGGGDDNNTSAAANTGAATQVSTAGGAAGGAGGTVDLTAVDYKFNPSDM